MIDSAINLPVKGEFRKKLFRSEMNSNDDLLPLIRQVVQLDKIKVIDSNWSWGCNFIALNRERERLARAEKIYLKDGIHSAIKQALTETNINLIRLKRTIIIKSTPNSKLSLLIEKSAFYFQNSSACPVRLRKYFAKSSL